MFNYQNHVIGRVMGTYENTTCEKVYKMINDYGNNAFTYTTETWSGVRNGVTNYVETSPGLQHICSEWKKGYKEAYNWIHPKFVEFR